MSVLLINGMANKIPLVDRSVHLIASSPPYYGLRDYGLPPTEWPAVEYAPMAGLPAVSVPAWTGCLGLEPDPIMFVAHIVLIMREARRVLRDDGTLWLNFGDSYAARRGYQVADNKHRDVGNNMSMNVPAGLKEKDLIGIPWRVAFALQADGWWLRSDVIWAKSNPMPESVNGWRWERHRVKIKNSNRAASSSYHNQSQNGINMPHSERDGVNFKDQSDRFIDCPGCAKCEANGGYVLRRGSWRPTSSHEYVFMFAKSERYYCDKQAVEEPLAESSIERINQPSFDTQAGGEKDYGNNGVNPNRSMRQTLENFRSAVKFGGNKADGYGNSTYSGNEWDPDPNSGRNKRDVWEIPSAPYPGAHFATWPPDLVEPMIKAGTSERGVCPTCGAPWVRVIHKGQPQPRPDNPNPVLPYTAESGMTQGTGATTLHMTRTTETLDWRPSCDCPEHDPVPAVVLDLFVGSGTTLQVARHLGRNGIGLDLSFDYLQNEARARLSLDAVDALVNGGGITSAPNPKGRKPSDGQLGLPLFQEQS